MRSAVFRIILILIFFTSLAFSQQKEVSKDPYANEPCVYVSPKGNDNNPGTKDLPFKTIEVAIDKGVIFGVNVVKAAQGTYTPGSGLNTGFSGVAIKHHNIKLIGGYDENFTSITGYSILDGQNKIQAIIEVREVTNTTIENFIVMGATNREKAEKNGGGIYLNKSDYSTIKNIISSNNNVGNGAGICVIGSYNKVLNSKLLNNKGENGSGIFVIGNYNQISSLTSQSNTSTIWGGNYISGISNTINNSEISYNSAREGGGIYIDKGIANQILDSSINNNNAQNSGGGIFVNIGAGNIIKSTINNNISRDGGGVYGFKTTSLVLESN
ncbi:MAG: hypothetical protein ACP5KI_06590, partial [Brevinematia bacterium]